MGTQTNSLNVFNDEYIKKVLDSLNPKEKTIFWESLSEEQKKMIFPNEEALKNIEENLPYEVIDLAFKDPSLPHLTEEILKKIRFNELISISRQFKAVIETEDLGEEYGITLKIEFASGKDINVLFPLTEKLSKEFCLVVKTDKYTCEGEIRYSTDDKKFSIHNLKIYTYEDIISVYKKEISHFGSSLKDKIDNFLIKLGYDPENMTLLEKNIIFLRLVALVQKKYVLIDISKPELGKSFTFKSLDINLYSVCITRSTAFYNSANKQLGDFFKESMIYVADEISEITDTEFFSNLLVYKNGEGKIGDFQSSGTNRKSSNSVALLGNPKVANIDYSNIYSKRIDLFNKTKINEISYSFLSKMDSLLPSYGCRTLNKLRKDNKYDLDPEFKEIFITVLTKLREKDIDVAELFEKNNISLDIRTGRDRSSILNTVEGLIKILYPEVIDDKSQNIPKEVLEYFLSIAVLVRQTLNNQRAIKEEKEYIPIMDLYSSYRNAYFNYHAFSTFYTPHRVYIKHSNGNIEKLALDFIGIELNKKEADILKEKNLVYELNEISLKHSQEYSRLYLSNLQNSFNQQSIGKMQNSSVTAISSSQDSFWMKPMYGLEADLWGQPVNGLQANPWGQPVNGLQANPWPQNSFILKYNAQNTGYNNMNCNSQVFGSGIMERHKEYNQLVGINEKIDENTWSIIQQYSFHDLI